MNSVGNAGGLASAAAFESRGGDEGFDDGGEAASTGTGFESEKLWSAK